MPAWRRSRSRSADAHVSCLSLHFGSTPPLRRRACRGFLWNIKCQRCPCRQAGGSRQPVQSALCADRAADPQDERVATRVRPVPRRLVDGHMNVAHARRDGQSTRAEHRCNAHVLRTVGDHHDSTGGEWSGQRGIDDELRGGLCPGERDDLGRSTRVRGALRERCSRTASWRRGQHRRDVPGCMLQCDHVLRSSYSSRVRHT